MLLDLIVTIAIILGVPVMAYAITGPVTAQWGKIAPRRQPETHSPTTTVGGDA